MKKFILAVLAASALSTIALAGENCASCGGSMYFTGKTKTEWGKLFKMYKCPSGHAWWIKASVSRSPSAKSPSRGSNFSTGPKCPTCGASVYFTGKTYTEWGKLFKVYKCPSGHKSVGK